MSWLPVFDWAPCTWKKKLITKTKVFDALVMGNNVDMTDPQVKESVRTFNYVMLADRFGWTLQDIMELPQQFYDDCLLIISKQNAHQEAQIKKQQTANKYKRGRK